MQGNHRSRHRHWVAGIAGAMVSTLREQLE